MNLPHFKYRPRAYQVDLFEKSKKPANVVGRREVLFISARFTLLKQ